MPRTASGSGRNRPAGRRRPDEGHGQEEAAAGGRGRGLEEAAAGGAVAAGGRGSRRIEGGAGQAAGGDRRTGPAWERPPAESSGTCESWPPAAEARPGRAKGRRAAAGPQAAVRDEAAAARTKSRRRAVVEAGGGQMRSVADVPVWDAAGCRNQRPEPTRNGGSGWNLRPPLSRSRPISHGQNLGTMDRQSRGAAAEETARVKGNSQAEARDDLEQRSQERMITAARLDRARVAVCEKRTKALIPALIPC